MGIGFKKDGLSHGGHALASSTTTVCTLGDTYYKVGGTWSTNIGHSFIPDGSGKITYVNGSDVHYLLNGVSDLNVTAACKVTYALYKNGVIVPGAETPTDFTAASKIGNISISGIIASINSGDYFEVYAKSSVAGVTITHNTLMLNFWGDR